MSKTTTSHVHHTFVHISLSSLHYYDVKMCSVFESLSPAHTKTLINGNTIASLSEHAFFFHSFIGCTSCDIQYKFIIQHNKTRKEKKKRSKNPKGVGATGLTSLRGTAPKRYACRKWCITLSYSKTSVFVLPRVNEWPAFFLRWLFSANTCGR